MMFYKINKCRLSTIIFVFLLILSNNIFSQFPSWGAIGSGINGIVNSVIVFNDELIAAGSFTTPGRNIAKYNGTGWDTLGTGTNDTVFALAVFNNNLIAVGSFDSAGGVICHKIAQWNGGSWSPLGSGADSTIYTVYSTGALLIAGGGFTSVGGVNCSHVASWQGSTWSAMGLGVDGNVYALEQFGNGLIIGGAFTMAGPDTAKRIVRFDLTSETYTALGPGIDSGNVFALSSFQDVLYAGGDFVTIGGDTVNHLAFWNDTNWFAVGTGINGTVKTLDSLGGFFMCIGGAFTSANGTNARNIVAYGGSFSFAPFGGGLSGGTTAFVNDIVSWRGITAAGGLFTNFNGNIARWGLLPVAPELILPEEAATGVSVAPLFTWVQGQWMYSFDIQIARDANFLNITLADSNLMVPEFQYPSSTPLMNLTTYFWKVRAANGMGKGPYSLIRFFTTGMLGIINTNELPLRFNLYQNYPNPFNPVTKIKFDLPQINRQAELKLNIYSVNGEKVTELLNTEYTAGKWELTFDATNLASGIYFCKIEAGPYVKTNKMVLVK